MTTNNGDPGMGAIYKLKNDEFKVLNRKSFVRPKIWFKYNGNDKTKSTTAKVDWDLEYAFVGSPIFDLLHFLGYSPEVDIILKKKDEVLQAYHTALTENLNTFKYGKKKPELNDLKTKVASSSFYSLLHAINELNALHSKIHIDELTGRGWNNPTDIPTSGMKENAFVETMKKFLQGTNL